MAELGIPADGDVVFGADCGVPPAAARGWKLHAVGRRVAPVGDSLRQRLLDGVSVEPADCLRGR